jgi:hypothetical protein
MTSVFRKQSFRGKKERQEMPNPNELQRLEEERAELTRLITTKPMASKRTKEIWLRELRAIERQLGLEGRPYNSVAFGGDDGENGR